MESTTSGLMIIAMLAGGLALLGGLCILPIVLSFRSDRRKRELDHIERIKALEMGRPIPGEEWKTRWAVPYQIAVSIGVGVPATAFGCAFLATMMTGYHDGIWIAAGIAGLGSAICGKTLAATVFAKLGTAGEDPSTGLNATGKPYVTDDAYDVVSSRG